MSLPMLARARALVTIDDGGADKRASSGRRNKSNNTARIAARGSGLFNRAMVGLGVIGVLIVGAGSWSTTAMLSGAVVAPGKLVVDTHVKPIQHAEGGIVGAVLVRNGDLVAAGQLLMRIDDTQASSNHGVIAARLLQLKAEKARLEAERDRGTEVRFEESATVQDARAHAVKRSEQGLFEARRRLNDSQKDRLRQRIDQVRKELRAIGAQKAAKQREIDLVQREVRLVDDLHKRQLANVSRLMDTQRQLARFEGELAALDSQLVRTESQMTEFELQIIELEQRASTEAYRDIREVDTRIQELSERQIAAEDRLRRTEVRSPVSGFVHDLAVHSVGTVLRVGETAMYIVPDKDALGIEVRVSPTDVDQVVVGQRAMVRLTALNQRTTPQLVGEVVHVGADLTRDPQSGSGHYVARIALAADAGKRAAQLRLIPGMPVEGFIETGERTPLSYLLKPIVDSFSRAMREQ